MGKLVAIWGKGGAGKSTLASNIACCLALKGHLVGIVGTNTAYGSIQHYFGMQINEEKSLWRAVEALQNDDIIKNFVQHPGIKDLFVLSMANSDDCLKLENISNDKGKSILLNTKDAFDYYIVDCTDKINDALAILSLPYADKVIEVLRPTVQGIAFHIAHEKLLDSLKVKEKLMIVTNCNKNFISTKDLEAKLKMKVAENLPYSLNVERSENTGEPVYLSGGIVGADRQYIKAVERLATLISSKDNVPADNQRKRHIKDLFKRGERLNGKKQ